MITYKMDFYHPSFVEFYHGFFFTPSQMIISIRPFFTLVKTRVGGLFRVLEYEDNSDGNQNYGHAK